MLTKIVLLQVLVVFLLSYDVYVMSKFLKQSKYTMKNVGTGNIGISLPDNPSPGMPFMITAIDSDVTVRGTIKDNGTTLFIKRGECWHFLALKTGEYEAMSCNNEFMQDDGRHHEN